MKSRDFKKGQVAYKLSYNNQKNSCYQIVPMRVLRVNRTFVSVGALAGDREAEMYYPETSGDPYLTAANDPGICKSKLFLTEGDANDYLEAEGLRNWLREACSWGRPDNYSLEQLRAVKDILSKAS